MVKRQDPDNFPRLQTPERCALEIAAYVFNVPNKGPFMSTNGQTDAWKQAEKQYVFQGGDIIIRVESYFSAFHWGMKCRLNQSKLDVIFPTFHTSVKCRKIIFNS